MHITVCTFQVIEVSEAEALSTIEACALHEERPITTGKQMLMRHLTFNSITLPLCPLLLCGIIVSSTGRTDSLEENC